MGRILSYKDSPENAVSAAAQVLRSGGILVYPTQTVYGIGGNAKDDAVASAVREIKGRFAEKPMLVLTDEWERLASWMKDISATERHLMTHSIASRLTLLFRASERAPKVVLGNSQEIGIRRTADHFCRRVIALSDAPLISTSANFTGSPPPSAFDDLNPDLTKMADLAIDAGKRLDGRPSTVVRLRQEKLEIVREGSVSEDALMRIVRRFG